MKSVVIEIEKLENGYWEVRKGHLRAEMLGVDEALGCVASALFRPEERPMYMRTQEEIDAMNEKFRWRPAPLLLKEGDS